MIPFFAPFTAPDGSTRRPIVERVPECRPFSLTPAECGKWLTMNAKTVFVDERLGTGSGPNNKRINPDVASDLCCMACLRWMTAAVNYSIRNLGTHFERGQRFWMVHHKDNPMDDWRGLYASGSDDANAFNALAHAVADELGIEH